MTHSIYLQAAAVGALVLSVVLAARANTWARIVAERAKRWSFFGLVHSEDYLRACYRFSAFAFFIVGLMLLAMAFGPAGTFLGTLLGWSLFGCAAVFILYSCWRFGFRRK